MEQGSFVNVFCQEMFGVSSFPVGQEKALHSTLKLKSLVHSRLNLRNWP